MEQPGLWSWCWTMSTCKHNFSNTVVISSLGNTHPSIQGSLDKLKGLLGGVQRCHLPLRLESAGRCNAPWQGPGHTAVEADMLQATESGGQELAEGPSRCKLSAAKSLTRSSGRRLKGPGGRIQLCSRSCGKSLKTTSCTAAEQSLLVIPPHA